MFKNLSSVDTEKVCSPFLRKRKEKGSKKDEMFFTVSTFSVEKNVSIFSVSEHISKYSDVVFSTRLYIYADRFKPTPKYGLQVSFGLYCRRKLGLLLCLLIRAAVCFPCSSCTIRKTGQKWELS